MIATRERRLHARLPRRGIHGRPFLLLSNSLGTTADMWADQMPALHPRSGSFATTRADTDSRTRRLASTRSINSAAMPSPCSTLPARRTRTCAGCRSAASRACGSACTPPTASTASCWRARPPGSEPWTCGTSGSGRCSTEARPRSLTPSWRDGSPTRSERQHRPIESPRFARCSRRYRRRATPVAVRRCATPISARR